MSTHSQWNDIHAGYKNTDWANKPSIFAAEIIKYLPVGGVLLDLGAGLGQDSRFFAEHGLTVTSTDTGDVALDENRKRSSSFSNIMVQKLSLEHKFPYSDGEFDVVYAHLSLHYFNDKKTEEIFNEIYRVLKHGGIFAFFTNSTNDPEFNSGKKLEEYYFEIEGLKKRYFTPATAKAYAKRFHQILCDNNGETYKDSEKGIHNLIRYIGRK